MSHAPSLLFPSLLSFYLTHFPVSPLALQSDPLPVYQPDLYWRHLHTGIFPAPIHRMCLSVLWLKRHRQHMLSEKDLSSGELETLKRSRSPITVVTANVEVQTIEEAQVYVHDLHIFVTVQLLENTPAVLSLGKFCKEHGNTYEWPSGREARLNQNGKQTFCKTKNLVLLVVPGLSSSTSTSSTLTSHPHLFLSIQQTCEVTKATVNCSEGFAGNCNGDGVPEWLEDFTENLEIVDMPAAANISHDSDPECPFKVASRTHSIFVHFPKDQKLAQSPSEQKLRGLKANWWSGTSGRDVGWCDYSWSQSPQRRKWIKAQSSILDRGTRFSYSMDSVFSVQNNNFSGDGKEFTDILQDLATQWSSPSSRLKSRKSFTLTYSLEFCKSCEDLSWNHRPSTPHRSETNGIAERAVRRIKEGPSAVLLQSDLDENWSADSVECSCYMRNVQDASADGRTPCERRFGKPFKGPIIPFGAMVEQLSDICKRPVNAPPIWVRKSCQE